MDQPIKWSKRRQNPEANESVASSNDSDDSDVEIFVLIPSENQSTLQGSSKESREFSENI